MGRWHGLLAVSLATLAMGTVAGCTNAPPPPLVSTPPGSTAPNRPVNPREVVVGVDSVAGGFNPHKLADQSAVTTALANLLLPSVFRPAPDGTPRLDTTLMLSAEVTRARPYTITYEIRREASWADSAPIAAEDFVYLHEQLSQAPDAIDGAGYRLISDITARDGGKSVEVTFAKPYPGWRSLFTSLVPAHLLKDAPGGWANALRDNFPTTGGPFALRTVDRDRGEIALERNDRYWERPATPDRIVLRRGDQRGVVEALRAGHDQLALLRLDTTFVDALNQPEPVATVHTVPRPSVASLLLRPVGPDLSDASVRQAVVAFLDRDRLISAGAGGGPAAGLVANAQVLAPTAPGYTPTLPAALPPARPDRDLATTLLGGAGYVRTADGWSKAGRPLSLVIAAPAERQSYLDVANEVVRQLTVEGIQVRLLTVPASELVAGLAGLPAAEGPGETVNLVVAPRPVGGDPATTMATNLGCVARSDGATVTPLSVTGSCDPAIQPTIDAAVTGAVAIADALSVVEPAVWRQAVSVPLYQEAETLVVRPEMVGVDIGPALTGPFAGATDWRRSVR